LAQELDMVDDLLERLRKTRKALFRFRAEAEEVNRNRLNIAYGYFTSIVSEM